jgi:hypothetical protein
MNPSKLTNPQFFSQVRKKPSEKFQTPKPNTPIHQHLLWGKASPLGYLGIELISKSKTLQAARRQVMKATQ